MNDIPVQTKAPPKAPKKARKARKPAAPAPQPPPPIEQVELTVEEYMWEIVMLSAVAVYVLNYFWQVPHFVFPNQTKKENERKQERKKKRSKQQPEF